jgi:hypothetical protein
MRYIAVDVRDNTKSFKDWKQEMVQNGFTFNNKADLFLNGLKSAWHRMLWVLFTEEYKELEMYYDNEDAYFDDGEERYPTDLEGCLAWMLEEIDEEAELTPYQADKILLGRL